MSDFTPHPGVLARVDQLHAGFEAEFDRVFAPAAWRHEIAMSPAVFMAHITALMAHHPEWPKDVWLAIAIRRLLVLTTGDTNA